MNLTAGKKRVKQVLLVVFIFCLSIAFCGAYAQGDTMLTMQLKGITFDGENGWRAVTLSADFRVLTVDEQLLGQVTAGAKLGGQETDTIKLSGVTEVLLQPVNMEVSPDFVFAGNSRTMITDGVTNFATVFAYAKQGFFSVNTTGAAAAGAEYSVLNEKGEVCESFTMDETGSYRSLELLPSGEYKLLEMRPAQGMQPAEAPIAFTIGTYFGNEEDVAIVSVDVQPTSTMVSVKSPDGNPIDSSSAENQSQTIDSIADDAIADGKLVHKTDATPMTASLIGILPDATSGQMIFAVSATAKVETQTDGDGTFLFDKLPLGDYSIYLPLPEGKTLVADSAWRITKQKDMLWVTVSLQTSGTHILPVLAFQTVTSIEGCAYVDINEDMICNEGEQLMTGVPVALQRANGDTWEDVADTKTDEYGKYSFQSLVKGDYRVVSTMVAGKLRVAAVGSTAQAVADSNVLCSKTITLSDGDSSKGQADISLQAAGALLFTSFNDTNGDGVQSDSERAVGGIEVAIMNGDATIASGITDASGVAKIDGIYIGTYSLRMTLPSGVAFTVGGTSSCLTAIDSSGSVGTSDAFTFVGGQTVTAGVGVRAVGSFSGKVFEDMNNNGVMDEDEPGAPGIVIHLVGEHTGMRFEFTTNETGLYSFGAVPNDNYELTATLPEGVLFARYSRTGGDLRSLFSGSTVARQFVVKDAAQVVNKNIGVIEKGVIAGHVFLDINYNGMLDEGEPGFAGVMLEVIKISNTESMGKTVSDKEGNYRFEGLRGGDYRLRAILPDDGTIFTVVPVNATGKMNLFAQNKSRRENSIQPVSIESGGIANTLVGVAVGATVTGTVFQDADYNGSLNGKEKKLSGIKVQLVDEQSVIVATDTTSTDGKYSLTGIMPGSYQVKIQRKPAFGFTRLRPGEKSGSHIAKLEGELGLTAVMPITMGETIANVNAGMLPASTVTGLFFHDENDDGLQSAGEKGMLGASVRLLSEDSEIDLTMPIGADGKYFFDGVMPGNYTLTYILPEHTEMAHVAPNGNSIQGQGLETTTSRFAVAMGEAVQLPLAGAVTLGNFTGYVFHDVNGDGMADEGEERMVGATITLTSGHVDPKTVTATSGTDGSFDIVGLRPAEYKLTIKLTDGYIFSHDLILDALGLDAVQEQTVDCSWQILTSRAEKIVGAVKPATVMGVVWLDENKDGTRGNGEMLMSDVFLELVDESSNAVVKHTTSTAQGFTFDAVRPGRYTVRFALPNQSEFAMDRTSTFAPEGLYMQNKNVVVTEAVVITELSTGLVSQTSIGGHIRMDENGESSPIAGVTLMLFMGGDATPLQTIVTGDDGSYRFDGLWPADYHLQASLPSGLVFVKLDDPNYKTGDSVISVVGDSAGTSEMFYLQMAQHMLEQNIIYIKPAKVGDLVWLDVNRNGLIDGGEPRIPGVQISLLLNGKETYQTVTDAYGYYLFDNVYPGTYTLQATAYPELSITKQVPALRIISSCLISGDGVSAQSELFSVISGSKNLNNDLGYILLDGQAMPTAIVPPPVRNFTVNTAEAK